MVHRLVLRHAWLAGVATVVLVAACSGDETSSVGTPTGVAGGAVGGSGGSGATTSTGGEGGDSGGSTSSGGGGSGAAAGAGGEAGAGGSGGAAGAGGDGGTSGGGGSLGGAGGTGGAGGIGGIGGIGGSGGEGGNTCPQWYADTDEDGYGDPNVVVQDCNQPTGYVDNADDCDDGDDAVNPDGTEICDGKDNDCNSSTDDGVLVTFDGTNYGTIQDALDAAANAGSGTVAVCPGTYPENLTVAGDVTVLGIAGAALTTVEPASGQETTRVVTIGDGLNVRLEGLTIRGASTATDGGGVWASTGGVTELVACVLSENAAANGGGAYLLDGELFVTDSLVELNSATGDGGALYAAGGTLHVDAVATGTTLRANDAARGGGIAAIRSGTATLCEVGVTDAVLSENIASLRGGGLYLEGTDAAGGPATLTATLANTTIGGSADVDGNSANEGGGIAAVTSAAISLDALSTVAHNQASAAGGGVMLEGVIQIAGPSLVDAPTITANTSSNHAGGISVTGQCALSYLIVSSNTSTGHGGGLRLTLEQAAPTILMTGVRVQDNQAGTDTAGEGGGIAVSTGRLTMTDCELWDNRGVTGGGIVVQADSNVVLIGGSVLRNGWSMSPDPDLGGGAWIKAGSGQLNVVTSDWGTAATDNLAFDVWVTAGLVHSYTGYGPNSTFTCTNTACG